MAHLAPEILIVLLISGALLPVAFGVMFRGQDETCVPVPSFIIPAFAELFYNSTNHRWYNVTSETFNDYNSTIYSYNAMFPNGEYVGSIDDGANGILVGQKVTLTSVDLIGKNITGIQLSLWKRLNDPEGNATIGIFNPANGNLIDAFGTIDVSTLNSFAQTNYTFVNSVNHTLANGELIGIKYNPTSDGDNYIQYSFDSEGFDPDNGVYTTYDGTTQTNDDSKVSFGLFFSIHQSTVSNYTLIAYPENTNSPDSTPVNSFQNSVTQCFDVYGLMGVIAVIAITIIMLIVLKGALSDRD